MGRYKSLAVYLCVATLCATALLLLPYDDARGDTNSSKKFEELVLSFDVDFYDIEGNKLLEEALIQRALVPYIGVKRTFADLQKAVQAVQNLYKEKGYSTVNVVLPPQNLASRRVKIEIIESVIGTVLVQGVPTDRHSAVRKRFPELQPQQVPNRLHVTKRLDALNRSASRQYSVIFRQGLQRGTVDAVIRVAERDPQQWSLRLDNWGTDTISPVRLISRYQHQNVSGNDDTLGLSVAVLPTKLDRFVSLGASYTYPLLEQGGELSFNASYSYADSGRIADILDVGGKGTSFGLQYRQHLAHSNTLRQSVTYGAEVKYLQNDVQFLGVGPSLLPNVLVAPVSVTYNGRWQSSESSQWQYSAGLTVNLLGDKTDYRATRANADVHYSLLSAAARYTKRLESDWYLQSSVEAQLSASALIPTAKMGVGGGRLLRALDSRTLTGDGGLQWAFDAHSPNVLSGKWSGRFNTFVEAAAVYDNAGGDSAYVSDVGLGFALMYGNDLRLNLSYAHVVFGSDATDDLSGRFYLSFEANF